MVNPLLIVGAGAGLLWLVFHGKSTAKPEPDPLPTPVPTPTPTVVPAGPVNGVYPDVTMTLGEAQKILTCIGILASKTPSGKKSNDGIYGDMTSKALSDYQTKAGLPVNGYLDSATAAALSGETCPAAKADWADIGTTYGYSDSFSSGGRNYNPGPPCGSAGAKDAAGNCDQSFLTGYAKGFGGGTYEYYFREGYAAAQSGVPHAEVYLDDSHFAGVPSQYVSSGKKGISDGFQKYRDEVSTDGSTEDGSGGAATVGLRRQVVRARTGATRR